MRRLVLAPLAFVLCLALIALSPLVLLVGAVVDLAMRGRPNHFRTVRLFTFLVGYLVLEVASFVVMLVLWVASGFGATMKSERMQDKHYGFMRWWLLQINRLAHRTFGLRVQIEDPPTPRAGPVLIFARHAGPGNSLLVVGTLLVGYRRRPRIVMLAKLQWEPLYDIMLNRLPN
ncbi:MAG: hypothetical protein WD826_10495, partial [Actinomycetota bacterium]